MPPPSAEDWEKLNELMDVTFNGVKVLIRNCREACVAKGIPRIAGRHPDDWVEWMTHRVGQEPLLRLVFLIVVEMSRLGLTLFEVMARDPQLLQDCLQNGSFAPYHLRYGDDV